MFRPRSAHPRPFWGILCLIFATLAVLALWDYDPDQTQLFNTESTDRNMIGNFGSYLAYYSILLIGVSAWSATLLMLWLAGMLFFARSQLLSIAKFLCAIVIVLGVAVFGTLLQVEAFNGTSPVADPNYFPQGLGGWLGSVVYTGFLQTFIGTVGTLVVFGIFLLFAVYLLFHDNLLIGVQRSVTSGLALWADYREQRRKKTSAARSAPALPKSAEKSPKATRARIREQPEPKEASAGGGGGGLFGIFRRKKPGLAPKPQPFEPIVEGESGTGAEIEPLPLALSKEPARVAPTPRIRRTAPATEAAATAASQEEPDSAERGGAATATAEAAREEEGHAAGDGALPGSGSSLRIIQSERTRKANIRMPRRRGDYVFPPLNLLTEPISIPEEDSEEVHRQTAALLIKTLEEFGVKVTLGEIHAGPVITRYDVYPAPGVRVEKIVNLDKNIALGLKALSVRILAPVPGKGCVGIEVPNRRPQSVYIRDILESEDWADCKAEIPVALGKEVSGRPLIADLTKMPHLLIAGSTGSGKTVCINAVITSLLYHSSPEDLRFVMVDPKIVEMQVYNSLPHMLVPVVTDPKKVPNALRYLLNEMERRYQIFAQIGVRNIAGYNAKMAKSKQERDEAEQKAAALDAALTPEERAAAANATSISVPRDLQEALPEKLPYVVCIVDELADLMMVAPADIETGIARLAQLARAAGIHLILATQRPSVNVITGVIKANLPSRIAFKVASKVDSRTILDCMGADQLIGKGDMLFLPPGSADLQRAQGAFVGDDEIAGIVEYVKEHNGEPDFDEQFQRNIEESDDEEGGGENGEDDGWDEPLVRDAIEVLRSSKRASTSMLQRRLKIGYNRAARIMEILEEEGIVGPENGSSPREILKELD